MSKLRADGYLNVGLRAAEVGKIPNNAREPGPRASVVQVVSRIGGRKIRILMGQIVAVQTETELQPLTRRIPTLGGEKLHPIKRRRLHDPRPQRPDRIRGRIREGTHLEIWVLRRGWKAVTHIPVVDLRLLDRHKGVDARRRQVSAAPARMSDRNRYA